MKTDVMEKQTSIGIIQITRDGGFGFIPSAKYDTKLIWLGLCLISSYTVDIQKMKEGGRKWKQLKNFKHY